MAEATFATLPRIPVLQIFKTHRTLLIESKPRRSTVSSGGRPPLPPSMFLKPPSASDKLKPNRSNKGAFSNKAPAKIKPFKPAADEEPPPPPPPKQDTPFVKWLREQPTEHAWHKQAVQEYLLTGPPYKGDANFDAKAVVKAAGGTWVRNPAKRDGCDDRSIPRGWWAAPDENALRALLDLPRSHCARSRNVKPWRCLELGDTQMMLAMQWLNAFREATGVTRDAAAPVEAVEPVALVRHSKERARDVWDGVPEWIMKASKRSMKPLAPDTVCATCQKAVCDQFLDCDCPGVVWRRCAICGEKYRVDVAVGDVASVAKGGQTSASKQRACACAAAAATARRLPVTKKRPLPV